jgi:hypothetical protein
MKGCACSARACHICTEVARCNWALADSRLVIVHNAVSRFNVQSVRSNANGAAGEVCVLIVAVIACAEEEEEEEEEEDKERIDAA